LILVDSNILMYAAGAGHPNKDPSIGFLGNVAEGRIEAALDAEALQEILQRYRALNRWREGRQVYDLVRRIFPLVIPITAEILDRARHLLDEYAGLMARDALHAAVVELHSLEAICSYDRVFDRLREIRRVEPQQV
jgi:predicted nucleic acid-binding protein